MEARELIEYFQNLKITNNNQRIYINDGVSFTDLKRYINSSIERINESTSARIVSLAYGQLKTLKELIDKGEVIP